MQEEHISNIFIDFQKDFLTQDAFIFSKKHEGKKEVYLESYLRKFIEANMDISKMT